MQIRVAQQVRATTAEGPGLRHAVWVQGCSIRCAGCCNPEMFAQKGGELVDVGVLAEQVIGQAKADGCEGITLLGGEPFEQAEACAEMARLAQLAGLTVVVFTGYEVTTWPWRLQAPFLAERVVADFLRHTDVLVAGPFDRTKPEPVRRWVGSSNQTVHFLSDRYEMDESWRRGDEVVVRLRRGKLEVHGWPEGAKQFVRGNSAP